MSNFSDTGAFKISSSLRYIESHYFSDKGLDVGEALLRRLFIGVV